MTLKLRTFLLTVIGLAVIPLLVVAGLAIWWAHQDERRATEQALLHHARSLTGAVDREVETTLAELRGWPPPAISPRATCGSSTSRPGWPGTPTGGG